MRLNAVKILGISVTINPKNEILEEIQKYLVSTGKKTQKSLVIYTPNTEQLVLATKNPAFSNVLNQADIAIPDTVGVVWASRMLGAYGIHMPIPGVEFMEDLVEIAIKCHVPIGLIGGKGKIAVKTLECLRLKYGKLQDSWAQEDTVIHHDAKIIFVALGAPKQEFFIAEESKKRPGTIFMAVGGSFDIISGRLRRAPVWMRKLGLEWFWRLMLEPWRLKRQLALIQFVWLVLKEKL